MKTNPLDPTLRNLKDCGCCAGTEAETPAATENRPGLPRIAFRAGTHAQFKASLLAALSDAQRAQLGKLRTREDDDFTIALLDGFAAMADVLTFYSERIANEGFLRTATERRSVLELARAIGYELNPGVAAGTWLAFTVEDAPGAPGFANIPIGTKIQSVPGPDEQPQVFETVEEIEARKEWNRLQPLVAQFVTPHHGMTEIRLKGTATQLKPGDVILIVGEEREKDSGSERWDFRRVQALEEHAEADAGKAFTLVTLDRPLGSVAPWVNPTTLKPKVYAVRLRVNLFGSAAPDWKAMPDSLREGYLGYKPVPGSIVEWPGLTIADISDGPPREAVGSGLYGEYFDGKTFDTRRFSRTDAKVDFDWGGGSPDPRLGGNTFSVRWTGWLRVPKSGEYLIQTVSDDGVRLWLDGRLLINNWTDHAPATNSGTITLEAGRNYDLKLEYYENTGGAVIRLLWKPPGAAVASAIPMEHLFPRDIHTVHLDGVQKPVVPESWLVVSTPEYQELYRVKSAVEDSRTAFTLSAKTTRLTMQGENLREKFNERVRAVSVFAQSELLEWADTPISALVSGLEIKLDREVQGLTAGRALLVQGRTVAGEARVEAARIAAVGTSTTSLADGTSRPLTRLSLAAELSSAYDPATVSIFANVAFATHGETVEEIVGHGDASQAHQQFALKQAPLTFTPANTPTGSESSLEVFVNDVKWAAADSLYGRGRRERVFVARREDDGTTRLIFGDGQSGALLPTGRENIRARYRKGVGLTGNVKAGQLTLLMNRPLGAKSVTNPAASGGAQDPEQLDDARRNAPLQTLTLGRIVSLQDYEDFARAFGGIAKAHATWVWTPRGRGMFVTVVVPGGAPPPPTDTTLDRLATALHDFGNPLVPLKVVPGTLRQFALRGRIIVQSVRIPEKVKADVDTALREHFKFDARQLGQNLALSEVIALIQNVPGVESVTLTKFDFAAPVGAASLVKGMLVANRPQAGDALDTAQAAEVLMLAEESLPALEVKPV